MLSWCPFDSDRSYDSCSVIASAHLARKNTAQTAGSNRLSHIQLVGLFPFLENLRTAEEDKVSSNGFKSSFFPVSVDTYQLQHTVKRPAGTFSIYFWLIT